MLGQNVGNALNVAVVDMLAGNSDPQKLVDAVNDGSEAGLIVSTREMSSRRARHLQSTTGAASAPPPSVPRQGRRRPRGLGWAGRLEVMILVGPALIFFVGFVIFPVIMAAYYGFFRWSGFGPATDFIGLQNYVTIFTDPLPEALGHNAFIVVLSLVLQGPVAILLALLLNRKMRGQSVIRVLIFVPYVIAEVIVGTGFSLMLATNGAVNGLLEQVRARVARAGLARPTPASRSGRSWRSSRGSTSGSPSSSSSPGSRGSRRSCTRPPRSTARPTGRSSGPSPCRCSGPTLRIWAFLSIIGALQLFDLVYIIWGQYVSSVAGTYTMAIYMVANRTQLRQLRVRQRRRRRDLRHLAGGRPDLPALDPAP